MRKAFVQLNTPQTYRWLAFDVDRPGAAYAAEDANIAAPNAAVVNPANGHAHLLYALAAPVHATSAARRAPLGFLADIECGMLRRLGADRSYAGVIAKNPLSGRWRTRWAAPFPYRLEQLDADLTRPDKRRLPRTDQIGLGRNCTLFEALRHRAYRDLRQFTMRCMPETAFRSHLEQIAVELNQDFASSPAGCLSRADLRATARSIAKFCYRRMSADRFSIIQRHRAEARTRRHMLMIEALKRGDGS